MCFLFSLSFVFCYIFLVPHLFSHDKVFWSKIYIYCFFVAFKNTLMAYLLEEIEMIFKNINFKRLKILRDFFVFFYIMQSHAASKLKSRELIDFIIYTYAMIQSSTYSHTRICVGVIRLLCKIYINECTYFTSQHTIACE